MPLPSLWPKGLRVPEIDCRELEGETCLNRLLTLKCWLSEMSRGAWLHMYAATGQYEFPSN